MLREKGYKIIWTEESNKKIPEVKDVNIRVEIQKNEKPEEKDLDLFLKEECDESLHKFIRTNVFNATRNFIHRVKAFR